MQYTGQVCETRVNQAIWRGNGNRVMSGVFYVSGRKFVFWESRWTFDSAMHVECTSTRLPMRCDADADADADAMCIPIIGTPWGFEANGCALEPYTFELPFVAADSCDGVAECSCDHKYRGGVLVSNRVRIFTLVDPQAPCQNTHSPSEAISRIGGFFSFAARWMMLRAWLRQ
jgi:hypothetical protein